jgi:hypothetical protein
MLGIARDSGEHTTACQFATRKLVLGNVVVVARGEKQSYH